MNKQVVLLFVSFVALVGSEVISNEQCEGRDGENSKFKAKKFHYVYYAFKREIDTV